MKLNCDLGESFGIWTMGQDEQIMPLIDMANIACGFHASDPTIMQRTVKLAAQHDVMIGAHPAYHDLQGFGRRSIPHTVEEIQALLWYQIGALDGICRAEGVRLTYVKPHGALNNDMMRDDAVLRTVLYGIRRYGNGLALVIPVTRHYQNHQELAAQEGVPIWLEAFADRTYDGDGQLRSRKLPDAVHHDASTIVEQARSFAHRGGVHTDDGQWLELPATTLCVHGDNAESLDAVAAIREALGR